MIFWITATALTLVVAALFVLTLLRAKPMNEHPAEYDLRVYRDQLREVDRDLARGVIDAADAERIRAEVGRRVLAADAQLQKSAAGSDQPQGATRALAGIVVLCLLVGTVALYPWLGQPGKRDLSQKARIEASDQMRATRQTQAQGEAAAQKVQSNRQRPQPDAQYSELMNKLRETVADRPDDLQGHILLARNEATLGNFVASYQAQKDVIRLKGDKAEAADYATLAEMMVRAAGGYVSPDAEDALKQTLARDPRYPSARYFTGLMFAQNDRPDKAFRLMDGLLRDSPPDAPWVPAIRSQIEELAWRAGVRYTLPEELTAPKGPTAADIANAANMTPDERQQMVRSMVDSLSEKLATQGGSAQDWGRLIAALAVIGEQERASAIWAEAQKVFAEKPDQLAIVRQGAAQAGLLGNAGTSGNTGANAIAVPAPVLRGPSADDIKNAADMTPEERQDMIRGMVANLSDRLKTEGGTAQEWARLITSQATLGDQAAAKTALMQAQEVYKSDPAALKLLDTAAKAAGLAQ